MDIDIYVRDFLPDQGDKQFAAIAFDLSIIGGHGHPPPEEQMRFGFDPEFNSPSGPWSATTVELKKSSTIVAYELNDETKFHNHKKDVHPEQILMKFLYPHYFLRYYAKYNQLPRSVSLFTRLSPCEECLQTIRNFPSYPYQVEFDKHETVGIWALFFKELYCNPSEGNSEDRIADFIKKQQADPELKTHRYVDSSHAQSRADSLKRNGWQVICR